MMEGAPAITMAALLVEVRDLREGQKRLLALVEALSESVSRSSPRATSSAKSERKSEPSEHDEARIALLLPVIHSCLKGKIFTTSDLIQQYSARHSALRAVLSDGQLTGKQLGKLFARFDGVQIGKFAIHKRGKCANGCVWCVISDL